MNEGIAVEGLRHCVWGGGGGAGNGRPAPDPPQGAATAECTPPPLLTKSAVQAGGRLRSAQLAQLACGQPRGRIGGEEVSPS